MVLLKCNKNLVKTRHIDNRQSLESRTSIFNNKNVLQLQLVLRFVFTDGFIQASCPPPQKKITDSSHERLLVENIGAII